MAIPSPASSDWEFRISLDADVDSSSASAACPPPDLTEQFRQDGFIALEGVLSSTDVHKLNDRLEHVLRGNYDRHQPPDKAPRLVKTPYRGPSVKPLGFSGNLQNIKVMQVINVRKCDALFDRLACDVGLARLVGELAGWNGTRLAQDQVWAKPPGSPPLGKKAKKH